MDIELIKWAVNAGISTVFLIFTYWKILPRLDGIENAIHTKNMTDILKIISDERIPTHIKEQASEIIKTIPIKYHKKDKT